MPPKIDITGQVFGRLTVLGDAPRVGERRRVLCLCSCGSKVSCDPRFLGRHTNSCGCLHREVVSRASSQRVTHGRARSPEYNSWLKLRSRCKDHPANIKYPIYGGRGISVCKEWELSFESFFAFMGAKPHPQASVERKDVNGNYEPDNCCWAMPKEQARNKQKHRLVAYLGTEMPLSQACELAGVNYRSALYRLNAGSHWMPLPSTTGASDV